MDISNSIKLFTRAQKLIPGGVPFGTRIPGVGGTPLFIRKAKGSYLYDADGNKYTDYIASWGPMIPDMRMKRL
jgi:glutamate-1-semialdehyde 2,1-aminomutase